MEESARTPEGHRARHVELHQALDELFADFIRHTGKGTHATLLELIEWSHGQTIRPTGPDDDVPTDAKDGDAVPPPPPLGYVPVALDRLNNLIGRIKDLAIAGSADARSLAADAALLLEARRG